MQRKSRRKMRQQKKQKRKRSKRPVATIFINRGMPRFFFALDRNMMVLDY